MVIQLTEELIKITKIFIFDIFVIKIVFGERLLYSANITGVGTKGAIVPPLFETI